MPTILTPEPDRPYVIILADNTNELLTSVDRTLVESLYMQHGALLFRGFELNLETFQAITSKFCTGSINNESSGREIVDKHSRIQTVNTGSEAFELHPELSREPWKPDVCWFGCIKPPSHGGETTICDGIEIVNNMPSKMRNTLSQRRLLHMTNQFIHKHCEFWLNSSNPSDDELKNPPDYCPYYFSKSNGNIYRNFTRPMLHKPMFSEQLAFGNFLLFSRYMGYGNQYPCFGNGAAVSDELLQHVRDIGNRIKVSLQWIKHDLLMLDNTRYMHGRNRILDPDERLIYSYFGYLNFARPSDEEPANALWRNKQGLLSMQEFICQL